MYLPYPNEASPAYPFDILLEQMLVRLVDDFLLVTTDKDKAVRFVQTMHHGASLASLFPIKLSWR